MSIDELDPGSPDFAPVTVVAFGDHTAIGHTVKDRDF
jgi:hypothetical protein